MIKRILILNLLLSFSLLGISQTPTWQWIKGGGNGSKSLDYAFTDLGTDNEGNIYGVCRYNGYVQFDTLQWMMGYGGVDFCVVSYTCDGQFRWVKRFGGQVDDSPAGITVMKNGDCIITGTVGWCNWGDAYFADSMVTANNSICRQVFICKLDKYGNIVYLNFPSKLYEWSGATMLNEEFGSDGLIHVLTTFFDSTTWGNYHIPDFGNYLLKFDPNNGQMTGFVKLDFYAGIDTSGNFAPTNPLNNTEFKIDKSGDYYFHIFDIADKLFIGNDTIIIDQTSNYSYVGTLARFDSQGNNIWYKEFRFDESLPFDTAIFGLTKNFAIDANKIYISGTNRSYPGTYFMGFPINNPIAYNNYTRTMFILSIDKYTGNAVNYINTWNTDYVHTINSRIIKNGKLYSGGVTADGLTILNNGTDTVKPIFTPTSQYNHGYFPFIFEIDTGLTHFSWASALKSYGSGSFSTGSIHIDHNDNIYLGTKLSGGFMLPQDTVLGQYTGAYIMKIAPTNDSCDCEASMPSVAIMGSSGNTLTISGSATNSPDSLYVFWGDGDSSLYANLGTNISHTYSNQGPWDVCLRSYAFCGDRDTCLSGLYLGIETIEDQGTIFSVYPNPAEDKINILFSEIPEKEIEIQIHDITGRFIRNQFLFGQKQTEIDLSSLNKGVYLFKIESKDGWSKSVKVIKN